MIQDNLIGCVYCNFLSIDIENKLLMKTEMPRYLPGIIGLKKIDLDVKKTHFISIFLWTQMFEALTLIRKEAYEQTEGWDEKLGNIGEGVDLFCKISLNWKVIFINKELYNYRRYNNQVTNVNNEIFLNQSKKIIYKWENQNSDSKNKKIIEAGMFAYKFNNKYERKIKSLMHNLKYHKIKSIVEIFKICCLMLINIFGYFYYYRVYNNLKDYKKNV